MAQAAEREFESPEGEVVRFRLVGDAGGSAKSTAIRILQLLADDEIEQAALLSTAPRRRYEVLTAYRASVGEIEFRRVFSQFLFPENTLVAEVAIEAHRLLIWKLGEAGNRPAAQYYVEIDGRFLIDDVPNAVRARLRVILNAYRSGNLKF